MRRRSQRRSTLPPTPDFEALEAAIRQSSEKRVTFFALIGDLNFAWSNNESLFIYVLMLLLDSSEPAAAIVFSTLNTTRARLDLVQRLAKVTVSDKSLRTDLDKIVDDFSASTRLRNDLNHAAFVLGANGEITHTQNMKIEERRGDLRFGATRPVDAARMEALSAEIRKLYALNRRIWQILPRLEAETRAPEQRF